MKKKALLPILGVVAALVALCCVMPASSYAQEPEKEAINIAAAQIDLSVTTYTATSEVILPHTQYLTVSYKGKALVIDEDYTVAYTKYNKEGKNSPTDAKVEPKETGTYLLWVLGQDEFAGQVAKGFVITNKTSIEYASAPVVKYAYSDDATFTTQGIQDITYDGTYQQPEISFGYYNGSAWTALELGVDYTVSYQAAVYPGVHYIYIEGIGDYAGTITAQYNIVAYLSQCKIGFNKLSFSYTGSKQCPKLSYVRLGRVYYSVKNFNVTGSSKSVGASTLTVTSNYPFLKGEYQTTYKIYPATPQIKYLKALNKRGMAYLVLGSTPNKLGAEKYVVYYRPYKSSGAWKSVETKTNAVKITGLSTGRYTVAVYSVNGSYKSLSAAYKTVYAYASSK